MAEETLGKIKMDASRLPKPSRVKNKQPAPIQISAEQILREAKERQEAEPPVPKQKITDPDELADYRMNKRKEFEDNIRKARSLIGNYIKYAQWEEQQRDFVRARSVYERGIDIEYRNVSLWLKYADMEMRHRNVNHARNVWDRAITLLPRVDQFWYKYAYMEEMIGNIPGARVVFERWMEWNPDEQAWLSYVKLEQRYQEFDRCRNVFERYVGENPTVKAWLRYAKFEIRLRETEKARSVFDRAVEALEEYANEEEFYAAYAKFEERVGEGDRARAIYKYALDNLPKHMAQSMYKSFIAFEKQYGDRAGIEDVVVGKRRFQYEELVKQNPHNYDSWFDYARLEEENGDKDKTRDCYERAISNIPPSRDKSAWKRYVYLWIKYALFEELVCQDVERAKGVYRECLKVIPHRDFTFSKVWLMAANLQIRQKDLQGAREILGMGIGMAPKDKIFKGYVELELQLLNVDRCRMIYDKYLQYNPANVFAWTKFAELERSLGETERARAVFELAVGQSLLDMPEVLWKSYVDFEIGENENENTRVLYERLLERTKHVKVYISLAQFEASAGELDRARSVYSKADKALAQDQDAKESRVMLLESWLAFEREHGTKEAAEKLEANMPKRVKKKRPITAEDGSVEGWEEFYDYIFPDENNAAARLKLLELAHKWKRQKTSEEA